MTIRNIDSTYRTDNKLIAEVGRAGRDGGAVINGGPRYFWLEGHARTWPECIYGSLNKNILNINSLTLIVKFIVVFEINVSMF